MDGILLGRLYAMREALDAIIETLEDAPKPQSSCTHPVEQRQYTGETMGLGAFTCGQCGETIPSAEQLIERAVLRDVPSNHP